MIREPTEEEYLEMLLGWQEEARLSILSEYFEEVNVRLKVVDHPKGEPLVNGRVMCIAIITHSRYDNYEGNMLVRSNEQCDLTSEEIGKINAGMFPILNTEHLYIEDWE